MIILALANVHHLGFNLSVTNLCRQVYPPMSLSESDNLHPPASAPQDALKQKPHDPNAEDPDFKEWNEKFFEADTTGAGVEHAAAGHEDKQQSHKSAAAAADEHRIPEAEEELDRPSPFATLHDDALDRMISGADVEELNPEADGITHEHDDEQDSDELELDSPEANHDLHATEAEGVQDVNADSSEDDRHDDAVLLNDLERSPAALSALELMEEASRHPIHVSEC